MKINKIYKETIAEYLLSIADDKFRAGGITVFWKDGLLDDMNGNYEEVDLNLPEGSIPVLGIVNFHDSVYCGQACSVKQIIQENFIQDKNVPYTKTKRKQKKLSLIEAVEAENYSAIREAAKTEDINCPVYDNAGMGYVTSLGIAIDKKDMKLISFLVEELGAEVNSSRENTPKSFIRIFLSANGNNFSHEKHEKIVKYLLEKGADPNEYSNHGTVLHYAAENSLYLSVQLLIDHGAEIDSLDEYSRTPLEVAVNNSWIWARKGDAQKTIQILLEQGADPFVYHDVANSYSAYVSAFKLYKDEYKEKYFTADIWEIFQAVDGINEHCHKNQPLLHACLEKRDFHKNGRLDAYLTHPDIDINVVNDKNETALMWAGYEGRYKAFELLLEKGADINIKSKAGKNILDYISTWQDEKLKKIIKGEEG